MQAYDPWPGRRTSLAGALAGALLMQAAAAAPPDGARTQALVRLVRQDCGACHGMLLKGGLGPALSADVLRDKPREALVATILGGRPGTPMPPWRAFLSEDEAGWIVDRLQAGFPRQ
ncbi:MAG: hypothetical protein Fur0039_11810 [Rhodocyclaceae bacterium]